MSRRCLEGPVDAALFIGSICICFSGVVPANQTKERSVHELFTGATLNQNVM